MEYFVHEIAEQEKAKERAENRTKARKNKKRKPLELPEPIGTSGIDCYISSGN